MSLSRKSLDQNVYVIGHRNPDTDAICSAIGYADFLKQTRMPEAVAARCGDLNDRTSWIVKRAQVRDPLILMDVRPTAHSICHTEVTKALKSETFLTVYQRMAAKGYRSIPLVDEDDRVLGMPTIQDLLLLLMPTGDGADRTRCVNTSLANIALSLEGEWIVPGRDDRREDHLVMIIAASSEAIVAERMNRFSSNEIIVIVGDREGVHEMAIDRKVRCLIITGGFTLSPTLEAKARENNVAVVTYARDTASAAQLVRGSCGVQQALRDDFLKFSAQDLVQSIWRTIQPAHQPLFPVVYTGTDRLLGVFAKSDLIDPPRARLVLVDHNEFSQAVIGADEAEILEVIDHHRLSGNLVSKDPIRFINEPLGSTSTIVGRMFRMEGLKPTRGIATCLCAGIISDTLKLSSPTATPFDSEILTWLAEIAEIDIDSFAEDFFSAGSVLQVSSPRDAINSDRKEYEENAWRISISQIEELGLDHFWARQEELRSELEKLIETSRLNFACLLVTDITRHYSVLLVAGAPIVTQHIRYPVLDRGLFELDGIVSRKKQLFPLLSNILSKLDAKSSD